MLILLVVLGHLIEPLINNSTMYKYIYITIYAFHMPLFVFISGYLLKLQNNRFKIISLLTPYIIFQLVYFAFDKFILKLDTDLSMLYPNWILWFIFSLLIWNYITPYLIKIKYYIPIAFIIALIVGMNNEIYYFLSLSRTLVYLPLFLIGHAFEINSFKVFYNKIKNYNTLFIVAIIITIGLYINQIDVRFFYGSYPYELLNLTALTGVFCRVVIYVINISIIAFIISLMSYKKSRISYIGGRTLGVYLIHGLIVKYVSHIGLYQYISPNALIGIILLLGISILITILLSNKLIYNCIKSIIKLTDKTTQ